MGNITVLGVDLAKSVFHLHGVDQHAALSDRVRSVSPKFQSRLEHTLDRSEGCRLPLTRAAFCLSFAGCSWYAVIECTFGRRSPREHSYDV
ncbi:MAG: hypothetical protein HW380_2377 [Magnetococcales bacterium]|nr:hypothetical protein [Magnetococcales bacterium]